MSSVVSRILNVIFILIGQFVASEILTDPWLGLSENQAHFYLRVLLFVQGVIQTILTEAAHYFNPDGSRAATRTPPEREQ